MPSKFSPSSPAEALTSEIRRADPSGYVQRLHCIVLVIQGFSCQNVAELFGRNPRTIERWVRQFRERGLNGLRKAKRPGRTPKMGEDRLAEVIGDLLKNPKSLGLAKETWDGALVAEYLRDRYGIELSIRQCQRLIRQAPRFKRQASEPRPAGAASEEKDPDPPRAAVPGSSRRRA